MGWLDSKISVQEGNISAFFSHNAVTLELIADLSANYKKAKLAVLSKQNQGLHNEWKGKSRRIYERAVEDRNYKMDLLIEAIRICHKENIL